MDRVTLHHEQTFQNQTNKTMKVKGFDIILASNSPRRKELLRELGLEFGVRVISGIDESYPDSLKGEDIPKFISGKKSDAYLATMRPDELIVTADTIVYSRGKVMGKPHDASEARSMLRELSGKEHEVITGVTLLTKSDKIQFAVTSTVKFAQLSEEEINYYVDKYAPLDKAGAYGIQEWIGCIGVEHIQGSFYNVMGLPVQRLYTELKKHFDIAL